MATVRTQGLIFPLELSAGKHVITEGDDLIKSSIRTIISWPLYTREYEDEFGSRIYEALEDQNDDILVTLVKKFVIDAITRWENRIDLKKLTFDRPDYEKLIVDVLYRIRDINIEDTLRYTFYTN